MKRAMENSKVNFNYKNNNSNTAPQRDASVIPSHSLVQVHQLVIEIPVNLLSPLIIIREI